MTDDTYIYGLNAVLAALEHTPDSILELWVNQERNDKRMAELLAAAERSGITLHTVTKKAIEQLASGGVRHQGVVARCHSPTSRGEGELAELLDSLERLERAPFLLVLDGVQDPHNLGACFRSADAAGVQAIIAPRDRAASLTPAVIKIACGAAQTVPFFQVTNLARTLRGLKERGIWLVGLDGQAEQTLFETNLRGPLAIVMGAEGQGLRRLSKELCDFLASIPMVGTVESLNVSVATGICLFEALRQRQERQKTPG